VSILNLLAPTSQRLHLTCDLCRRLLTCRQVCTVGSTEPCAVQLSGAEGERQQKERGRREKIDHLMFTTQKTSIFDFRHSLFSYDCIVYIIAITELPRGNIDYIFSKVTTAAQVNMSENNQLYNHSPRESEFPLTPGGPLSSK
jgi:hypothetical protein